MDLTVVIPAFNEEARIVATLASLTSFLSSKRGESEVIVVDDGSRDRTADLAEEALRGWTNSRVIRFPENRGKGAAVKEGILLSQGDLVLFSDADLSTPIEELGKFLPLAEQGYDVIIGCRALPESDIQIRQAGIRELLGKTFNLFVRLLVMKGICDTQCGFKLFRKEAARKIFPLVRTRGFGFDVEVLYLAQKNGFRIRQVPVIWRNSPKSEVKIVRSSVAMFADLWRIRRRHLTTSREKGKT
jgi:dolichyl-phosphate beta-glucosyltransferase